MITFVEGSLFSASQGFSLAQCISGKDIAGWEKRVFRAETNNFLDLHRGHTLNYQLSEKKNNSWGLTSQEANGHTIFLQGHHLLIGMSRICF